ncbi:ribosomal lysine N-methyltransferase 3 [Trichomonascus vanleenenianus]|uniref:protein-lysine N-methyltransferase n=1 Tax=Trichomonascus vanleenenianus TaxID=2268995 RepID=UPI003ECAFA01
MSSSSEQIDDKYQELVKWMVENKIDLSSSLNIAPSKLGGYGVFANKKIPKETLLLTVPKKCVLSPATCGIANLLEEHELDGMIGLTVAYMFERAQKEKSPWYPFLQTIDETPTKQSLPRFWAEEQQEWLTGTQAERMGGLDESEVSVAYEQVIEPFVSKYKSLFEGIPSYSTLDGYKTALMNVCSRAFEVDYFRGLSLVPGACLFNHSDSEDVHFEAESQVCDACGNAYYCDHIAYEEYVEARRAAGEPVSDDDEDYEEGDDSEFEDISDEEEEQENGSAINDMSNFVDEEPGEEALQLIDVNEEDEDSDSDEDTCDIRTIRNISSGKEIFNSYGDMPNGILISRYGFAIWDNKNESISLSDEIMSHIKTDDLKKRHKWWGRHFYTAVYGISPDEYEGDDDDIPHPEAVTWEDVAEIDSTGRPTKGLRMLLNVLSMTPKKFMLLHARVKRGNYSASPDSLAAESRSLLKALIKRRLASYQDGNLSSAEYKRMLDAATGSDEDTVRKRLAITVRGTEKLVLERALKTL